MHALEYHSKQSIKMVLLHNQIQKQQPPLCLIPQHTWQMISIKQGLADWSEEPITLILNISITTKQSCTSINKTRLGIQQRTATVAQEDAAGCQNVVSSFSLSLCAPCISPQRLVSSLHHPSELKLVSMQQWYAKQRLAYPPWSYFFQWPWI